MPTFRFAMQTNHRATLTPDGHYSGVLRDTFPEIDLVWGSGDGDGQAEGFYCDERELGADTNEDLDLTALSPGPDGNDVNLAEVRVLAVACPATNDDAIEIAPGAANGWTALLAEGSKALVQPGTVSYLLVCPVAGAYPVGAANKVLNVNNPGGAGNTYTLLAIGPTG